MRYLLLAALLVPAASAAKPKKASQLKTGGTAGPTGKSAPACGVKVLPLVVGNTWTYSSVAAPVPPTDQVKRMSPAQPKTIVIMVKTIEPKGGETVATLEEKMTVDRTKDEKKPLIEEFAITSTITCNDKKFDISPNSFFFAGEPGGTLGLDVDKVDRKGTSWALAKGALGEKPWREDLVMHWARKPTEGVAAKLGSGKLEMERQFTPQDPEAINTKLGVYKAEKIGLLTTGRVTLEGASPTFKQPAELPANWVSQLWVSDSVGVVQTLNSYAQMFQLSDVQLK